MEKEEEWFCPECAEKKYAQCSCRNKICTFCGYVEKKK